MGKTSVRKRRICQMSVNLLNFLSLSRIQFLLHSYDYIFRYTSMALYIFFVFCIRASVFFDFCQVIRLAECRNLLICNSFLRSNNCKKKDFNVFSKGTIERSVLKSAVSYAQVVKKKFTRFEASFNSMPHITSKKISARPSSICSIKMCV